MPIDPTLENVADTQILDETSHPSVKWYTRGPEKIITVSALQSHKMRTRLHPSLTVEGVINAVTRIIENPPKVVLYGQGLEEPSLFRPDIPQLNMRKMQTGLSKVNMPGVSQPYLCVAGRGSF